MHVLSTLIVLPLAVVVNALSVTSPAKGAIVDPKSSLVVKWTSVNTDPQSFDIYVVNNAVYPTVEKKVASDVDTDKGSYTIKDLGGIANGHGFQINLLSDSSHNTGILAQSQQFNVSDGKQDPSTSTTATLTSSSSSVSDISTTGSTTGYSSSGVSTDSLLTTLTTATGSTPTTADSVTATSSGTQASSISSASGSTSASATPTFNAGETLAVKHHAAVIGFVGGAMAFLF